MAISITPTYRAAGVGVAAAALLVGAFSLGAGRGGTVPGGTVSGGTVSGGTGPGASSASAATVTSVTHQSGRITVTGNGTVTGVPNQLSLSLSVQVNGYSVSSALSQANQAVRAVTAALTDRGVAASDIQTSDLNISPNYQSNNPLPSSYGVSESLTATLDDLATAGAQIDAAVRAGGNAVSIDGVSLNLTNTGVLMAAARARAVADARAQARQFASALGEPLGPVISLSPVQQATVPYDFAANAAAGKAGSVPISPGTQQLTVSITVVYAV
jgi:uncharacterized protein YggE